MIIEVRSKLEGHPLLHLIHRADQVHERLNLTPEDQHLQAAFLCLPNGKVFKAHRHLEQERPAMPYVPQEAWVVVHGKIVVYHYDLDGEMLANHVLQAGDVTITFRGGHNYRSLSDETVVYEFKTGPYEGQAKDKAFL